MDSIALTDKSNSFEKQNNNLYFEWEILKDYDTCTMGNSLKSSCESSKCSSEEEHTTTKDWDLVSNIKDVISCRSSFCGDHASQKSKFIHIYHDSVVTNCIYCKIQLEDRKSQNDVQEDINYLCRPILGDDDAASIITSFSESKEEEYDAYFDRDCYKNARGGKSKMMFQGNNPNYRREPSLMKEERMYKKRMEIRKQKWPHKYKQLDFNFIPRIEGEGQAL